MQRVRASRVKALARYVRHTGTSSSDFCGAGKVKTIENSLMYHPCHRMRCDQGLTEPSDENAARTGTIIEGP